MQLLTTRIRKELLRELMFTSEKMELFETPQGLILSRYSDV